MDGASKFVKGDAIAGIIIVFINLIFGIIIGMLQMDMSIGEAINRFSMLTVGDGLVSQIPALLMSTATGIIVTRSASEGNLGTDITEQLFAYPKMMYVAGFAIILMGILTPIPLYITVPIGGLLLFGGYMITKGQIDNESETMETEEEIATDNYENQKMSSVYFISIPLNLNLDMD